MIAPQLIGAMNELAGKLGYRTVDGDWGTTEPPADLRVTPSSGSATADDIPSDDGFSSAAACSGAELRSRRLGEQLGNALREIVGAAVPETWRPHVTERFVVVALTGQATHPAEYWQADLGAGTVTAVGRPAQEESDWDLIGSVDAWESVMSGKVNFSVALRSCQIRYCDNGQTTTTVADNRIGIAARMLGLAEWS